MPLYAESAFIDNCRDRKYYKERKRQTKPVWPNLNWVWLNSEQTTYQSSMPYSKMQTQWNRSNIYWQPAYSACREAYIKNSLFWDTGILSLPDSGISGIQNKSLQKQKPLLTGPYSLHLILLQVSLLNAESRKLFLSLNPMERSFIGLTDKPKEIARIMPDALMERPTIENIMLGKIERGNASWQL